MRQERPSLLPFVGALSLRSDIIGPGALRDLDDGDSAPSPLPIEQVKAAIEAEFEVPFDSIFHHLAAGPHATLPLAQIHQGVTSDGHDVVVKILRPGAEEETRRESDFLLWIAARLERSGTHWRDLGLVPWLQAVIESLEKQIDLRFEAADAAELRDRFESDPVFHLPEVDWGRTGRTVLTVQRIGGVSTLDQAAIVARGHDPDVVADALIRSVMKQLLAYGFVLGSAHSHTFVLTEDGSLAVGDLGVVSRLDIPSRRRVARAMLAPGDSTRIDPEALLSGLRRRAADASVLDRTRPDGDGDSYAFPISILIAARSLAHVEAVARRLSPDADMRRRARPLIERWFQETEESEHRPERPRPDHRPTRASERRRQGFARVASIPSSAGDPRPGWEPIGSGHRERQGLSVTISLYAVLVVFAVLVTLMLVWESRS